jgi:hypothetical protein
LTRYTLGFGERQLVLFWLDPDLKTVPFLINVPSSNCLTPGAVFQTAGILACAPAVYLRGVENVLDLVAQSLRRHLLGLPNRRQGGQHDGQGDFISWGRSQIEPIHAWHAERGHLREDDQDRVAALAERIAKPSFCQCVPCVSFASSLRATRARNALKKYRV